MYWLPNILTALATGCIYSTMAVGVVLIYRTSRVLAFHVGEVGMVAAYIVVTVWQPGLGFSLLATALLLAAATAVFAGIVMYVLVERIGGRFGHFIGTVITIAATIALNGLMSLVWQGQTYRLPLFSSTIQNTVVIGTAGLVLIAIVLLMRRSALGVDMQAIANNATLARLRGVPVQLTLCAAWILGSLLSALSGVLIASLSVVSIEGSVIGISAIVAALIGGMTSIGYAIVGAFLLAGCETLVTLFGEPRFAPVVPVVCLLLLLIVRPTGLAGRSENIARV
jgi:branched-chain amino acid transport system permease protein